MPAPTSSPAPARFARHLRVITLLALLASNLVPVAALSAAERQLARAQAASEAAANPAPEAVDLHTTKIDSLQTDANGNGRPDAGDTLRYTVGISNTGSTDALSVTLNDVLDANTTLVPGSLRVSPLAFADQYFANRNSPLTTPAPGVLANDTGVPAPAVASHGPTGNPGATAAGATGPTDQGGTVRVNADGSFSYTPPTDFTGEDAFSYRIANGIGNPVAANVTLTVRQPAAAVDDSYNGATGAPINQAAPGVLANDAGVPAPRVVSYGTSAAPGTVAVPGAPTPTDQGGTVQVNADGSFSYAPPAGFEGTDRFGYTISNGVGPADSAVVSIVLDRAPRVVSTDPISNATGVATTNKIAITFSEPVAAAPGAFRLECPVGTTIPVTPSPSPATIFLLTPGSPLPQGVTCRVTVVAANIADTDTNDPPDQMAADYVFSFTTDSAPRVVSTAPISNAANIGTTAPIRITFSEPVNAAPGAFALECPIGTPQAFGVSASPATTFTLTPTAALPQNTACRVTVVASQITDVDAGDPPDQMAADYVFSFTTDAPPRVTTTGPVSGAVGIATNAQITVNFSEQVNAGPGAFLLECPAGSPRAFTLSASPATGFALTPTGGLPEGVTCRVTVVAAQITDTDAGDPPDQMAANFVFTFSTDAAPRVVSATPSGNGPITVLFSEPVSAPAAAFRLECPQGTEIPVTVSGGPTSFTVTPGSALPEGSPCRLTVFAAQISDLDGADPPDNLPADFTFDFAVDAAPRVVSTTPVSGATGVAGNAAIQITFSEPVVASPSAFLLECPAGTTRTYNRSGTGATYVLTPTAALPAGATCRVTVFAAQVTDVDANDPPDNMPADYVFSFTIDEAPRVISTVPVSNAAGLPLTGTVRITFSEPVNAPLSAFAVECPAGTPRAFAVSGSGTASVTLTPSAPLPEGVTCRVTVVGANITDVDAADPPDQMAGNYVFSFSTDAAPRVVSTTPANGATRVSSATTITVTFSEPVNAPLGAFSVECPVGDPVPTFSVSASPATVFTLTSSEPLPEGLVCTVT
ncbi:MAG TPA: Ig-like domain-containing protein, partial [Herpetosiphonaceae bacterium]